MRLISTSPSFTVDLDVSDSHHVEKLTMAKLATPQKNEWAHERDPHRGMNGLRSGGPHRRVNGLRSGGPHRGVNGLRRRVPFSVFTQARFNLEQGLAALALITFA